MKEINEIQARDKAQIMAVMKLGTFLALINETVINVALPQLMSVFSVPAGTVQWLTSGYMLILGVLVPVTAFLIERMTTRTLFTAAMSFFLAGTVLAAAAANFPMLLAARLVQGIGASVMMPLLMNTIMVLNPPEKRGAAMGSALLIILFAPAVGPTFGGMVLQVLGWRWIFLTLAPFGALAVVLGRTAMKNVTEPRGSSLDAASFALSAAGFGALLYGINLLCSPAASKTAGAAVLAAGAAALCLFVLRQLRIENPLLNVRAFAQPIFSLGMALVTISYMVLFANFVLMPMFLENALGLSAFKAGLAVLPGGILGAVLPTFFGRVYDKFGPRPLVPLGFAVMTAANLLISRVCVSSGAVTAVICYCVFICGIQSMLAACQTNSLNQLEKRFYAHGSAIMNTLMMIGSALGSAFFIAIMSAKDGSLLAQHAVPAAAAASAVSFAYIFAAALSAVGFALALFFKRQAAAAGKQRGPVAAASDL